MRSDTGSSPTNNSCCDESDSAGAWPVASSAVDPARAASSLASAETLRVWHKVLLNSTRGEWPFGEGGELTGIMGSPKGGRLWLRFATVMMGVAAIGGAVGSIETIVDYHGLTTRGVQATALVENAWRVKGGWDCSVSFSDAAGAPRAETVSGCGGDVRGQTISVTYARSDPSTIARTGSFSAVSKLGLAAFLAVISALLAFCTWALWRKPAWDARRNAPAKGLGPSGGSFPGSPAKRVRYRPRARP